MLVRYGCGCVGFIADFEKTEGKALVVAPCDAEWEYVGDHRPFWRTIEERNRTYVPLEKSRSEEILKDIVDKMSDGEKYRGIKATVKLLLS